MTTEPLPDLVERLAQDIDAALARGTPFDDVVLAAVCVMADLVHDRPADPRSGRLRLALQKVRYALGPRRVQRRDGAAGVERAGPS